MLKYDEDHTFNNQAFLIVWRNYNSQSSNLFLKIPTSNFTKCISIVQNSIKKTVENMPQKKDYMYFCNFRESYQDHYNFFIVHSINCKVLKEYNWK